MRLYFIWPICILFVTYFGFVPFYHGQHIEFYYLLFILFYGFFGLTHIQAKLLLTPKWFLIITGLLFVQVFAMLISKLQIKIPDYNYTFTKSVVGVAIFIITIYVHYAAMKLNINTFNDVRRFLRGGYWALIIALVISYIQLLYIWFPHIFEWPIKIFASCLEARWGPELVGENIHRFYSKGSYVQTTGRVNGLTQEASTNALFFSVVFVPFLVASIKNKINIFNQSNKITSIYLLLVLVIILLLLGKTTQGILSSILIILICFKELPLRSRFLLIGGVGVGVVCFLIVGVNNGYIQEFFTNYVNKVGDLKVASTANRAGNVVSLIMTIIQNPITGVGRGYLDYYIITNMPLWATNNFEYEIFANSLTFPVLSSFFGITAEYGVVFIVIFIYYLRNVYVRWKSYISQKSNIENQLRAIFDSMKYFFIFGFIGMFFNIQWYASIYLVLLFFFICVLLMLERERELK